MAKIVDPNFEMELEAMVDRHGLSAVLNELANICQARADRIHDAALASAWAFDAVRIAKAEASITKY